MAVTVADVTLISVTAVGARIFTGAIEDTTMKANLRIVEIIGGLLTTQLARRPNTKAAGAGIMVGALMGFVDDFFGFGRLGQTRAMITNAQAYQTSADAYMQLDCTKPGECLKTDSYQIKPIKTGKQVLTI